MSRRVGVGIAAVTLLVVAIYLSFNTSEDEVAALVVPSAVQPLPIGAERELVARFQSSVSRPTRYYFLQIVPDVSTRCIRAQVVCQGAFDEGDFREDGRLLLVFAPSGCRAALPTHGYANQTWLVWRAGQVRLAKQTHFTPEGAPSLGDYTVLWPTCRQ